MSAETPSPAPSPEDSKVSNAASMNPRHAAEIMARYLDNKSAGEDLASLYIESAPADLRSIPREEWSSRVMQAVTLPADIVSFVEGQAAFTQEELDRLEDRIAAYHGVTEPFYITAEPGPPFFAWLGFEFASKK
jgi:hypothetical protein